MVGVLRTEELWLSFFMLIIFTITNLYCFELMLHLETFMYGARRT